MREFQTTNLKSRAGTGIAGVFAEESAFLNPAGISFFRINSIYFQRDMMNFQDKEGNSYAKPKNTAFVMSEGTDSLSGTLSYTKQNDVYQERTRWGLSLASRVGQQSSFGVSVRKSEDENSLTQSKIKYYQTVFGILHVISPNTSLGIVVYDAFKSSAKETKAYIGIQQGLADYITLALDAGTDWNAEEISDAAIYRGALQVRLLNNFFFRFGVFDDKSREEKGHGFGLSWIQPRLALEFALTNSKKAEDLSINRAETKLKETSFSISYRF